MGTFDQIPFDQSKFDQSIPTGGIVPTSPSGTRVDLQLRLLNFFNNPNYYTIDDYNQSIQDAINEICAYTGCIFKSAVLPFLQYKTYYDMVTLLPDYIGTVAIFNRVTNRWLYPTSLLKLDQTRNDWEGLGGTPYYFSVISHRYMAIWMKPLVANYGNMYVYYVAAAPTLIDSTAIPVPPEDVTCVEEYCKTDLWEQQKEFSKATGMFNSFVSNLEQFRVKMQNQRNTRLQALK